MSLYKQELNILSAAYNLLQYSGPGNADRADRAAELIQEARSMLEKKNQPRVRIFERLVGDHRAYNDKNKFQADIFLEDGSDHHGVAENRPEALLNAALHWQAYEAKNGAQS